MNVRGFTHALFMSAAAALFAGCGGAQSPYAAGTMPQALSGAWGRTAGHFTRAAWSYQLLYRFGRPGRSRHDEGGAHPSAALIDVNGKLYGTTPDGGFRCPQKHLGCGTVFSISPDGTKSVVYKFHRGASDGWRPFAGLTEANGTLYGTTYYGGSSNDGVVFSLTTSGVEKVLYSFKGGRDGANPQSVLLDVNGTLYGTTSFGGDDSCSYFGCGTVYRISTTGMEKVLYRFKGFSDGDDPYAGLVDVGGTLYGTTLGGGGGKACVPGGGCGTVYKVSTSGAETVLYRFQGGTDGEFPYDTLIDVDGVLYGTTARGGGRLNGGTVFSASTNGGEKVLHRFRRGSDGQVPIAGLVNVNGILYGTTQYGGASCGSAGCGTVFSLTTGDAEAILYSFGGPPDGAAPVASLANVNGVLYGTTSQGGKANCQCGTVFTLSP